MAVNDFEEGDLVYAHDVERGHFSYGEVYEILDNRRELHYTVKIILGEEDRLEITGYLTKTRCSSYVLSNKIASQFLRRNK